MSLNSVFRLVIYQSHTLASWAFFTRSEKSSIFPLVSGYWNNTPLTSWPEKSKDSLSPITTCKPSPSGPRVLEKKNRKKLKLSFHNYLTSQQNVCKLCSPHSHHCKITRIKTCVSFMEGSADIRAIGYFLSRDYM